MKNLIFIFMLGLSCYASANIGDGTLPVIRSVQVEFLERGHNLQDLLPKCVKISVNKKIAKSFKKSIKLKQANLEQVLELKNNAGDIAVSLTTNTIVERARVLMRRQDLNQNEFLNEFNHMDNVLRQHVQVNPESQNSGCRQL